MSATRQTLSASTNGRPIKVVNTSAGSADTIHTAHATLMDEVWLWAYNSDTTARTVTILFGGTTNPDDYLGPQTIPANAFQLICPGLTITNSLVVKAIADAANKVVISGHVNRG